MSIEYYCLDSIEFDGASYIGRLGDRTFEVYPLSAKDSEEDLEFNGFAKCDAPGTETFVVEVSEIE